MTQNPLFTQAIECYLANVVPVGSVEWSLEAGIVLQELVMQENQVRSRPIQSSFAELFITGPLKVDLEESKLDAP